MAEAFANQVLRQHLQTGAARRELIGSRIRLLSAVLGLAMTGFASLLSGDTIALGLAPSIFVIVLVELPLGQALARGWYRDWVPYVATAIEVSIPAGIALFFAVRMGAFLYLASGVTIVWAVFVGLSTLRVNPMLSLMAGVVAALEQAAISLFLIDPALATMAGELHRWPLVWLVPGPYFPLLGTMGRSLFLLIGGICAAGVARMLAQQARDALRAVREQDLMGKYFLHEKLGAGGMAEVFRATYSPEGGFEKVVALKRVLPGLSADPSFTQMFQDEANLCSQMAHPNIVQVFDIGRYQSQYILAMEFIDGLPLNRLMLATGPFPFAAAAYVGSELCAALEYLHGRIGPQGQPLGFVHRDLNPPNVLVSRFGEVKLGDFGVARAATRLTAHDGEVAGKIVYMAPEQLRGEAHDGRADVFSLGLTLWELLAGTRAYDGPDATVLAAVAKGVVPPLAGRRPDVPPALAAIIAGALSADVNARPTARELRVLLLGLPPGCAPLPAGPAELTALVARARAEAPPPAAVPQREPETLPSDSSDHQTRPLKR